MIRVVYYYWDGEAVRWMQQNSFGHGSPNIDSTPLHIWIGMNSGDTLLIPLPYEVAVALNWV